MFFIIDRTFFKPFHAVFSHRIGQSPARCIARFIFVSRNEQDVHDVGADGIPANAEGQRHVRVDDEAGHLTAFRNAAASHFGILCTGRSRLILRLCRVS